ncbi:DNA helicase PIF1, ATP-dependent [Tanacetum coccineum]
MLDRYSSVAQAFRMARYWCNTHSSPDFLLRLHSEHKTTRQYNAPTVSEVAAIIINDFGDAHPTQDIVGSTLLKGGRLFQQYLVDAYTTVEEQRIKWTRNNQDTLHVDLYHNLCDAVTRRDTSVVGLGKRIILPRTFTGSPRYMMQNYKDAMALCRAYVNPDLFIRFTSNLKWPEISEMLAYFPGQKPHDRPEIRTRVLKIKLNELLDDLNKKQIFDESRAGISKARPATDHTLTLLSTMAQHICAELKKEPRKHHSPLQNVVRNRTSTFIDKETSEGMDKHIVGNLINMLDRYSSVAQAFRMARYWCNTHSSPDFLLRLHSEHKTTRQYNAPTVSEVAAIIVNDFGDAHPTQDIVYPLLFLYGEDGFHEKIPYHANTRTRKTKRGYVTMKEYYSYIIHQRPGQGSTLLKGGRLFQQYLVDAYTTVEEQRIKWTRNNQDTLHVDLYHNLCDAVTRVDTSVVGLGKRIILPKTFMGSPRYMMQNYQDAMALCRAYGNLDLFITFTSNLKWLEISEMLAYFPRLEAT